MDFEIEFTGLPKGLGSDPTLLGRGMTSSILMFDDSPFTVTNVENRPIQNFLQDWLSYIQSSQQDQNIDAEHNRIRINGHLVKITPVSIDGVLVTSELTYHPFIIAYFKRRKYSNMRYKYLKMKGLFRNVKR